MLAGILSLAAFLTLLGYLLAGRLAGLIVTALCSGSIAYFLMPPLLSFRVSQMRDLVALGLYCTVGLVLARTSNPPGRRSPAQPEASRELDPGRQHETDLAQAIQGLLSSAQGAELRLLDIDVAQEHFMLPCAYHEAVLILRDVLTSILECPEVRRVSIYGGQRPGLRRLTIAAQYASSPPQETVVIVKNEAECETVTFPGWPSRWHVTRYDDGFERIFRIRARGC